MPQNSSTSDANLPYPDLLSTGESLARHCSLRIGGPAQYWGVVETLEDLTKIAAWAQKEALPITVLGLGSNVLIHDSGIQGVVLRFAGELADIHPLPSSTSMSGASNLGVSVGAGVVNAHLVRKLLKQNILGAEFLSLIPGTMGGAVVMNAGIKGQELASILHSVKCFDLNSLQPFDILAENLDISYRHCELPPHTLVLGATLRLQYGSDDDVKQAQAFIKSQKEMRDQTQPYRLASVGSTFRNPEGDYAGRLIEAAGLKGTRVGHAVVSQHHANFFINEGGASSKEFAELIFLVQNKVYESSRVRLQPEVKFLGFDRN